MSEETHISIFLNPSSIIEEFSLHHIDKNSFQISLTGILGKLCKITILDDIILHMDYEYGEIRIDVTLSDLKKINDKIIDIIEEKK